MDEKQIRQEKQKIRRRILELRDGLPPDDLERLSGMISERVEALPEWRDAGYVCAYLSSKPGEVDTHGLIRSALSAGKRVCVPVIDPASTELFLVEIDGLDDLVKGFYGILEPAGGSRVLPGDIGWDLAVVPGLAFDRSCNRIGFGKGYYDRLLSHRRTPRIALAFNFQIHDSPLPVLPHDVPVDAVATETEVIRPA